MALSATNPFYWLNHAHCQVEAATVS
jgi:hypothetical protein